MGMREKGRVELSEVIKNRLYFAPLQRSEDVAVLASLPQPGTGFCIDNELVYEPFFTDFGPLNIACTYRFCWKLHGLLKDAEDAGRCVLFYCGADAKKKANAAVLLGAYLVLFVGVEPDIAYGPLAMFEPFIHFRDPTCGVSTYHLTVSDCIRAINKAQKVGWINFNNFNVEEYEYFEQVDNGDLNWMVPNKLIAFSGPSSRRLEIYGYRTLVPEDYVEYFHRVGVTGIIRLNRRTYDRRRFTDHGLAHYDLYFPDGSCPPERILKQFLEIIEETSGVLAVHCKAGLGRTGVLIGCYIMKHHRFTCNEVIGYLRLVRPGSVIGPQQQFLRDMQSRMWRSGEALRKEIAQASCNSREFLPSTSRGSGPPPSLLTEQSLKSLSLAPLTPMPNCGGRQWSSEKSRLFASRKYSPNLVPNRDSIEEHDFARRTVAKIWDRGGQKSRHMSWTDHIPPLLQRLKRSPMPNVSLSTVSWPLKEDKDQPNNVAYGGISSSNNATAPHGNEWKDETIGTKPWKCSSRVPTPARPSVLQISANKSSSKVVSMVRVENALADLALTSGSEPSCSSPLSKTAPRPSPFNGLVKASTPGISRRTSSNTLNSPPDTSLGILRNVGGVPKVRASGAVFVQRIINSAGQPRKVILPITQEGGSVVCGPHGLVKRKDSSPTRNCSQGRISVSQGNFNRIDAAAAQAPISKRKSSDEIVQNS